MTMQPSDALAASCRVALAAYLHDLGKFAERARLEVPPDALAAHRTQYCPWHSDSSGKKGYHSHIHAAYTALAFDLIERHAPQLIAGDMTPFVSHAQLQASAGPGGQGVDTDSLVNAAAAHHRPDTFLQWVIATADRVASGFEREEFETYNAAKDENTATSTGRNHYQARMLSLLEQIQLTDKPVDHSASSLKWRYPLQALSPDAIFPQLREKCEPAKDEPAQKEYAALWQQFLQAIEAIPASHRNDWALWLDHFDTAWLTFTHAIPAATAFGTKPEVSLYDHSKTTAALAVALWRWHEAEGSTDANAAAQLKERRDWDTEKFLLIQGDFFGIQDFIFADGSQTRKDAARLLRGRSFQVSLFTELAALRVLEALALPPISQITNAAGKFLIVAPNTAQARAALEQVRQDLNQWFLHHSFGLAGLGLAAKPASCNDFLDKKPTHRFQSLMTALFADLEKAKLHRFDLAGTAPAVFDVDYPLGVCIYNDRLPADRAEGGNQASAALSRDQIAIGKGLSRQDRLLVLRSADAVASGPSVQRLEVPMFGYTVAFTAHEDSSGKFGPLVQQGRLARCWDFSLPDNLADTLWHGYARRYINAYVPRFANVDIQTQAKYKGTEDDIRPEDVQHGAGKTLNHIACEDRLPKTDDTASAPNWQGQVALMTLKGDVDNLGTIFQKGLQAPTFAKMAALSRQMNAFFAVWLPAVCAKEFPYTYTVFAGGDDFFLIGPWHSTQRLASRMAERFKTYVAENPKITFSAGMVMTKPGLPMHTLATQAEEALDDAKASNHTDPAQRKNAMVVFGQRVRWGDEFEKLRAFEKELARLLAAYALPTGYVYAQLGLITLANDTKHPEQAMWRSRFAYQTWRLVERLKDASGHRLSDQARKQLFSELGTLFAQIDPAQLGTRCRIALFNHFYRQR
jgi:CRISPR-associated protein Csm1